MTSVATTRVKLLYFAWMRERIGKGDEQVDVPGGIATVAQLVAWLRERGPEYAAAFADPGVVRVAIDKAHVKPSAAIGGAHEIAFFPPVTGG